MVVILAVLKENKLVKEAVKFIDLYFCITKQHFLQNLEVSVFSQSRNDTPATVFYLPDI